MRTTIAGVPLIARAYGWSQRGVSYFISTCGSTKPCPKKYISHFEDDWGNPGSKEIDRPQLAHFLNEYLPLIDEHNKQRQSILALKKCWPTKDPWFRLLCTITGMAVVDFYQCFRYEMIMIQGRDQETVDEVGIYKFTDLICGHLKQWKYKQHHNRVENVNEAVARITRKDSKAITKPLSLKMIDQGRTIGNPVTLTCYICRRYLDKDGKQIRQTTAWWCKHCRMPLCLVDRSACDMGHEQSCIDEHLDTDDDVFGCNEMHSRGKCVPNEKFMNLPPIIRPIIRQIQRITQTTPPIPAA
jgi:hypothetical protein